MNISSRTFNGNMAIIQKMSSNLHKIAFLCFIFTGGVATEKLRTIYNSCYSNLETWFCDGKEMNSELEVYELFKQKRVNKRGGGVALFVIKA